MKKIFSFALSIALLGNILCSTVALAETDSKAERSISKRISITLYNTDPDTYNPH